jgi:hypothetical protein
MQQNVFFIEIIFFLNSIRFEIILHAWKFFPSKIYQNEAHLFFGGKKVNELSSPQSSWMQPTTSKKKNSKNMNRTWEKEIEKVIKYERSLEIEEKKKNMKEFQNFVSLILNSY